MNLRPLPPQGSTLPNCATSRFYYSIFKLYGATWYILSFGSIEPAVLHSPALLETILNRFLQGTCHVPRGKYCSFMQYLPTLFYFNTKTKVTLIYPLLLPVFLLPVHPYRVHLCAKLYHHNSLPAAKSAFHSFQVFL